MKEPLISFVVPIFKTHPEVLEKCLASLFDQSLKAIEVLCVFDGEDKGLEEVVGRFPKAQKYVIEHGGAPKARNYGTSIAKGKYVSCFDSDCYIKPEAAERWIQEFEATGADFVYSGYQFTGERGAYESEQFDPYSLQCGNFIASMFPILRSKAPKWDESLKAGQDWDFWLSAVENGCKASYIQGYAFETEPSRAGSISAAGWSPENRENTIRTVRAKHNVPIRDIAVCSMRHSIKALHIAKLLNADFLKDTGLQVDSYKTLLNIGYSQHIRFHGAAADAVKIQFWMPWDIDCLFEISHKTARETIRLANSEVTHHLCNEIVSQKRLAELGIEATIVPLPTEIDDLETSLPEDFRVLIDADQAYMPILADLPKAIPHVKIDFIEHSADITQYALLLSFYEHPTIDEGIRRFLLNGRHVISNVEQPYCGFVDLDVKHAEFKSQMVSKILDVRAQRFNKKAQDYYKLLVSPAKFSESLRAFLPKMQMEVVE